jgi:hypothetical protein
MGTILLIIIGIVVVMGIIGLALAVAKGVLGAIVGAILAVGVLVWRFPIPSIICVGVIIYTGNIFISLLLYAAAVVMLARDMAAENIKKNVLGRIEKDGIISQGLAGAITPTEDIISWLLEAVHERRYGVKVLDQEVEKGNLVLTQYNGKFYYYDKLRWTAVQQDFAKKVITTISEPLNSRGFVTDDIQFNLVSKWSDIAPLADAVAKEAFTQYMGRMVRDDRVFVKELEQADGTVEDNDDYDSYETVKEEKTPVKLYLNKEILSKKQQYIQGCDIIEGKDVAKVFGTTDLAQQKAIMEVITAYLWTEMSYEFIQRGERYLWVNKRKVKEHTCEKCDNIVQDLTQYGKQRYCKSCLKKIHDQEDADEAEGKAVKRYISAPPPGIKIKM